MPEPNKNCPWGEALNCEACIYEKYTKLSEESNVGTYSCAHPTKLRLLLFKDCNRGCPGCCNKDWNIENLPVCDNYRGYDIIMLTGGEPMLKPDVITDTIAKIRKQNTTAKIILYTAYTQPSPEFFAVLPLLDGLTLTLHSKWDVPSFYALDSVLVEKPYADRLSLRLNHFKEVGDILDDTLSCNWQVKKDIEWIENCPLPDGEIFMKLSSK